ncbi:D-alanyl-D-alanine carboxypeptidase [Candidatus Kaiserbacteria bacterium]|nr:D-alanyl-D-alanine carboxypeptidase [Candidatus Kaiserbacteria bacterium]
MDSADLQKLAERTRAVREAGFALLLASGVLSLFLFIPLGSKGSAPTPVTTTATSTTSNAFADISLTAAAAVVYDLATNEVLYAKNADTQLPLASLTKLLTVYAALTVLSPDTLITIPSAALALEGPRAFSKGQTFTLFDVARLTLTASLNDGATAIAQAAADRQQISQDAMLAGAASALNLSQTFAVNGTGLDVNTAVSGGYGSARDLAILSGALVREAADIAAATTLNTVQAVSSNGTSVRVSNTDPIVDTIPRLLLSKTGYTDLAGGNLALVFDVGMRHPIAIIVLGSSKEKRFTDSTALVTATLTHFANATH